MSFSDIKGHNNIVDLFKRALSLKRVGSSYIFFGPDGDGKALMAATLAKALNCLNGTADSCDTCASCAKIDNRNHPDVVWLGVPDKKDLIGIEQIKELERQIALKPYEGRVKLFIIENSDLMSEAAANCLLKTIEEPPRDSIIILITSRPGDLLPTVRSRCAQIRFDPVPQNSQDGRAGLRDYKNRVLDEFNSGKALLDENSFVFEAAGEDMNFIISVLAGWYRDLLVIKSGGPDAFVINSDRIDELKRLRDKFSVKELEDIFEEIGKAGECIERNVGPKLAFNKLKIKLSGK
ncbi:MAG: AAA family ATPase [Candidatus Omnitrophica bacterium]|nr:AAA family ATPase [Candidatus Omnitrophota bacterium]